MAYAADLSPTFTCRFSEEERLKALAVLDHA